MTKPNATRAAHFHAGHNDAGYMPEADVVTFATFEDGKAYMISELLQAADSIGSWSDPHDCDDIPCPTFGDDCPEQLASAVALAAEELNLENGPEWFASLSDGRSLPVSWWISPCYEDCEDEDEDGCECSCHGFQAQHGPARGACTGCGCGPDASEAKARPNLGDPSGSVAPGDLVFCRGVEAPVTGVIVHPAGVVPPGAPIRAGFTVVEVQTAEGSRFLGAHRATIGPDLRVTWDRTQPEPTFEHPYSGSVTISGDPRSDIAEAVELDHGCEDVACDIHAALAHGFVFVAAHSLMSATDAEVTSEVVGWYFEHGPEWFSGEFGTHAYGCSEWDAWRDHHDRYARPCDDCGSYSYAERDFEPLECGSCETDLVPTESHARRIAADWHPGMTSALLTFASTGTVRPDLRAEVEDEVSGDERTLLARWLTDTDLRSGRAGRIEDAALEANAPEVTFWSLLESPPAGCAEVAALWSWSLNYDAGKGPATLFLDLIGYSEDEYGQALYDLSAASLGFVEVRHLRDALSDYLADPHSVREFVGTLLASEASR